MAVLPSDENEPHSNELQRVVEMNHALVFASLREPTGPSICDESKLLWLASYAL